MGKAKKINLKPMRQQPLDRQIEEDGVARQTNRVKTKKPRQEEEEVCTRW